MPRRVIEGKSYNTDTALHIASAEDNYAADDMTRRKVSCDLYRTKAGAFFLVQCIEVFRGVEEGETESTIFYPLSYDQAHAFARGESISVPNENPEGPANRWLPAMQIDICDESVFPPAPEDSGEEQH